MFLGIEIGGTKLQMALGVGDGRIADLRRMTVVHSRGASGILEQIAEAGRPWRGMFDAVGIGFGGPVDSEAGTVIKSHQIEGWDGFAIADWARANLGVDRVAVENDADTAALGEARFGAGVGFSPVLYLTIGSGIGGGLILDGRIYRGSGRGSTEIGHLWIDRPEGSCLLEKIASGWSIGASGAAAIRDSPSLDSPMSRLCGADPAKVTAETVVRAAQEGDAVALVILRRATTAMGDALGQAVTLLAPRRIILGGGVSLMPRELWIDPIARRLDERAFPPFRGTFELVTARLGEEVVLHGALALASG